MTTPSFVGAGTPIYTAPFDSSAGFTVTTGDLPSGIQTGDTLFVFILATGSSDNLTPYLSTDLIAAGYNSIGVRQPSSYTKMYLHVGEYDPADFPASVPRNSGSLAALAARIETVAYRYLDFTPTLTGQAYYRTAGAYLNATLPSIALIDDFQATPTAAGGRILQVTFQDTGDIGIVSNGHSSEERHRQVAITNFGGGFVVADTITYSEPFIKYVSDGTGGVVMSIGLDADSSPEPSPFGPRGLGGWGVGETKDEQW